MNYNRMRIYKLTAIIIASLVCKVFYSQESLPFYQQYLISDKALINPSYNGSTDDWVVKGTYHKQWANFDLSPNTQTFSTHLNLIDRVGVGAYFFKDENGPIASQGLNLAVAYHIPLGNEENREENQFSFGTSLGLWSQNYDWTKIQPEEFNDPNLYGDPSIFLPYLNLGVSFAYKRVFGGISVTDIPLSNNTPIVNGIEPTPSWYYLNLGYDWRTNSGFGLEPSVLMNINTNSERQLDLNLLAKYTNENNSIAAGVSYRTDMDENGTQALTMSPVIKAELGRLNFGFAYNLGLSDIAKEGGNGFTIGIGYNIENFVNSRGYRYR